MFYLGTDLVYIPRIRAALDRFGGRFLQRVYTPQEQRTCWRSLARSIPWETLSPETLLNNHLTPDVVNRLAGRWAAKEAVVKALGTGWHGVGYKDVEITRRATGEPGVCLRGRALAALDRRCALHGQTHPVAASAGPEAHWQVSFSHDRDYATASAILVCGSGSDSLGPAPKATRTGSDVEC